MATNIDSAGNVTPEVRTPSSVVAALTVTDSATGPTATSPAHLTPMKQVLQHAFMAKTGNKTGIIIPFYIYPSAPYSQAEVVALVNVMNKYPHVPFLVIVNPASGPGTVVDGNYAALISVLKGSGATILGYVSTSWTARTMAAVELDVDRWKSLYSVDGIFFDEMSNANAVLDIPYYTTLTNYAHSQGYYPAVANPGTPVLATYFAAADIIMYIENTGYQNDVTLGQFFIGGSGIGVSPYQRCALSYGVAFDAANIQLMKNHATWINASDIPGPNPYGALPTYLDRLAQFCESSVQPTRSNVTPEITTATYTQLETDSDLFVNYAGTSTITLLSAAAYVGRYLTIRTYQAQTVVSASANVSTNGVVGTSILAATAGKWATLKSDGTNWEVLSNN